MENKFARNSNRLLIAFSIAGIFAMVYLSLSFTANIIPQSACTLSKTVINCAKVVTSQYSSLFLGIDNYYLGLAFFVVVLVLSSVITLKPQRVKWNIAFLRVIFILGLFGVAIAVYLIYLELFVIGAICLLCTVGQISIFAIFIISSLLVYKHKHAPKKTYKEVK